MKGNYKTITMLAFVFSIFFLFLPTYAIISDGNVTHTYQNQVDQITFSIVDITGNSELATFISENGFTGSGSSEDPYIIENIEITEPNSIQITLDGISSHLRLRNLSIKNGLNEGMLIRDSSNIIIEDSEFDNNSGDGIYVRGSSDIIIRNNKITNTQPIAWYTMEDGRTNYPFAIDVTRSSNIEIHDNILEDNIDGIWFWDYVTDSIAYNNSVVRNQFEGLGQGGPGSDNNTIMNNYISKTRYAIWSVGGVTALVEGNIVRDSFIGIRTEFTDYINVTKNAIVNNSYGIDILSTTDSASITYNFLYRNKNSGISFASENNQIKHNAFYNNRDGTKQMTALISTNANDLEMNFYDDWTDPDTDSDGIVDSPYLLNGIYDVYDPKPLTTTPIIRWRTNDFPNDVDPVITSSKISNRSSDDSFVSLPFYFIALSLSLQLAILFRKRSK